MWGYRNYNELVVMVDPMSWDTVLNPEAVLDCTPDTDTALAIKFKVDTPVMTSTDFTTFMEQLDIRRGTMQKEGVKYEVVTHLEKEPVAVEEGSPPNYEEPFSANVDLSDPTKVSILRDFGMERWQGMKGVIPSVFPEWQGISAPNGVVFGKGCSVGLGQAMKSFARMHYVAKGVERFVVLSRGHGIELHNVMRMYLSCRGVPENYMACPSFLNHFDFFFDEDFLVQHFKARAFDVVAGECVLIHAGIFSQVYAKEAGFALSCFCIPRMWLELDPMEWCQDMDQEITEEDICKLKENATEKKDYGAAIIKLAASRMEMSGPIPVHSSPTPSEIEAASAKPKSRREKFGKKAGER